MKKRNMDKLLKCKCVLVSIIVVLLLTPSFAFASGPNELPEDEIIGPGTNTETTLKANPVKISVKSKAFKASKLKKSSKSFTVKATNYKGKLTTSRDAAAKNAKIKIKKVSSKSGVTKYKITMPKKCKKGTYKITIRAAGNDTYKAGTKILTVKVK